MAFPWGAALAAAGSFAGALGGDDGLSRRTIRRRGKQQIFRNIAPRIEETFGASRRHLQRARDITEQGWTAALKETERLGRTGSRRILERERTASEGIQQSLTSRGLSGTTASQFQERGLRESTDRALSEHEARFSEARASMHAGRASAMASAERDLAHHYKLRYGTESRDIYDRLFALHTGMGGSQSMPLDLSGLGGFLDNDLLPWLRGLGGGGGLGSEGGGFNLGGSM